MRPIDLIIDLIVAFIAVGVIPICMSMVAIALLHVDGVTATYYAGFTMFLNVIVTLIVAYIVTPPKEEKAP